MTKASTSNLTVYFTESQTAKLSNLSVSTLRNWQRRGLIDVSSRPDGAGGPFTRLYTFNDIVTLRLLSKLRRAYQVPLNLIESTAKELKRLGDESWNRTIYVLNRQVLFEHPEVGDLATAGKQLALINLREIERETRGEVRELLARPSKSVGKISRQRNVLGNTYTLDGTRVRTSSVLAFHNAGYSHEQIRQEYPGLSDADIDAALGFERSRSESAA